VFFAVCWQMAKHVVSLLTGLALSLCRPEELPFASRRQRSKVLCRLPADGKEAFANVYSAGLLAICWQTTKAFAIIHPCLCCLPWQTAK
jgi:hypothetical protein